MKSAFLIKNEDAYDVWAYELCGAFKYISDTVWGLI